jgi:hypothetical protein
VIKSLLKITCIATSLISRIIIVALDYNSRGSGLMLGHPDSGGVWRILEASLPLGQGVLCGVHDSHEGRDLLTESNFGVLRRCLHEVLLMARAMLSLFLCLIRCYIQRTFLLKALLGCYYHREVISSSIV